MILFPITVEIKDSVTYSAKFEVPEGEIVALTRMPGKRAVTVQVEPGAGATATVYATLEGDEATLEAADNTAPYLIAWPAGGVAIPAIDVFAAPLAAICCHSVGGSTTFRVRC
jgi:hypothetical protein